MFSSRAVSLADWRSKSRSSVRCADCAALTCWRARETALRPISSSSINCANRVLVSSWQAFAACTAASAPIRSAVTISRRFCCSRRMAAAVLASGLAIKPSQRQTSPSRETSLWPCCNWLCKSGPCSASTIPICDRRLARTEGASTKSLNEEMPWGRD